MGFTLLKPLYNLKNVELKSCFYFIFFSFFEQICDSLARFISTPIFPIVLKYSINIYLKFLFICGERLTFIITDYY